MLEVQEKWWKIKPLDVGWHGECQLRFGTRTYPHIPALALIKRSGILEPYRIYRLHPLWCAWVFTGQLWDSVSEWTFDLLGQLGIFDRECLPAGRGDLERIASPPWQSFQGGGYWAYTYSSHMHIALSAFAGELKGVTGYW